MAAQDHRGDERSSSLGYFAAILVSALGHAGLFVLIFLVAPRYLHSEETPPPTYTVKIVDQIPAGDLGTHLPRLAPPKPEQIAKAEPPKPVEPAVEPPKPEVAPDSDKNAVSLATKAAQTPTPTPEPTVAPTLAPTPQSTPSVKQAPTRKPTPTPSRAASKHPKAPPTIVIARVESTSSVKQRLAKLRRQLLAEQLARNKKKQADEDEDDSDEAEETEPSKPSGGGPVAAKVASAGTGSGIGPGTGSAGILQDLDFLLYYQQVQDKIKKAWNFTGGSSDLTATVNFAIDKDGTLTGVKIAKSSNDSAFDESVIRAIRGAAPFPPPPEKYRDQWAGGIEAMFKLGELKS